MRFFTYIFCRRQTIIHAQRDYHSALADYHSAEGRLSFGAADESLPIIYVIRNYRSFFPAMFKIRTN